MFDGWSVSSGEKRELCERVEVAMVTYGPKALGMMMNESTGSMLWKLSEYGLCGHMMDRRKNEKVRRRVGVREIMNDRGGRKVLNLFLNVDRKGGE